MPHRNRSSSSSNSSASSSQSVEAGPSIPLPRSLPDLRFEQSYLATIRSFVQEFDPEQEQEAKEQRYDEGAVEHSSRNVVKGKGKGKQRDLSGGDADADGEQNGEGKAPKVMEAKNQKGEPELWIGGLRIQWAPLLYVTFRDQLLSPLLQGALWGLVGVSIAQFRSYFVAQRALSRDLKAQRLVGGPSSSSANSGGSGNGKGLAGMLGLNSRR